MPGAVHFYGGSMSSGPRAACGHEHMCAVLGEAFVPQEDPQAAGQCERCAILVAEGKGFRDPPGSGMTRSAPRTCASGSRTQWRSRTAPSTTRTEARTVLATERRGTSALAISFPLPSTPPAASRKPPERVT